jgi:hypothetical protein
MASFPPPDVNAARKRPTVRTQDANGYFFDTTSPEWKTACAALPSFAGLQWPGYATTCIPAVINNRDVIIQPWMGHCQQFLGRSDFPGGFGGEVGVYVKVPGGKPLPDLAMLPAVLRPLFKAYAELGGDHLWWPDADVQPKIDFTIINPVNHSVLLRADEEQNYWVNKWMEPASYELYRKANPVPPSATQYKMVFTVAGVTRAWIPEPLVDAGNLARAG